MAELGFSWDGMEEWLKEVQVPFMVKQHMERGRPDICVRKYILCLLTMTKDWTVVQRRKFFRITKVVRSAGKITTGDKFVLAFHPNKRLVSIENIMHQYICLS